MKLRYLIIMMIALSSLLGAGFVSPGTADATVSRASAQPALRGNVMRVAVSDGKTTTVTDTAVNSGDVSGIASTTPFKKFGSYAKVGCRTWWFSVSYWAGVIYHERVFTYNAKATVCWHSDYSFKASEQSVWRPYWTNLATFWDGDINYPADLQTRVIPMNGHPAGGFFLRQSDKAVNCVTKLGCPLQTRWPFIEVHFHADGTGVYQASTG